MIGPKYNSLFISHLNSLISALPEGHIGVFRNKPVVRTYGAGNRHVYTADSRIGKELYKQIKQREQLEKNLKDAVNEWNSWFTFAPYDYDLSEGVLIQTSGLNKDYFDSAKEHSNQMELEHNLFDGKSSYRSKNEMLVADIINELGFPYKTETGIRFENKSYYPDGLFYVPLLRRCFYIEIFGMTDSNDYLWHTGTKIGDYIRMGLVPGVDILFIFLNPRDFDKESIKNQIKNMIEQATPMPCSYQTRFL